MRKTNKNLTKQILTLMLAFVMVFTGMGIGSWGVDEAWADGETLPIIKYNGDNIASLEEIGTFEDLGESTFCSGVTKGKVYLACLPENAVINKITTYYNYDGPCWAVYQASRLSDIVEQNQFLYNNEFVPEDKNPTGDYPALYNSVKFYAGKKLAIKNVKGFAI